MSSKVHNNLPNACIVVAKDSASACETAAERFVSAAAKAIKAPGVFTVALSGGSTPRRLFELLASSTWRNRIDWQCVAFFWSDERYVPAGDSQSNYRMAQEALLSKIPGDPRKIFRFLTEEGSAEGVAQRYETTIRRFFGVETGIPKFDLMLLGLGTNGHTASLFPHQPILREKTRLVGADYVEEVKAERLSMTLPLINNAQEVLFLITGAEKAAIIHDIFEGPYQPEEWPAQFVQPTDGNLEFILDSSSGELLTNNRPPENLPA